MNENEHRFAFVVDMVVPTSDIHATHALLAEALQAVIGKRAKPNSQSYLFIDEAADTLIATVQEQHDAAQ
jgi:hypothetical protein